MATFLERHPFRTRHPIDCTNITVVGAGVISLTTACLLSRHQNYNITVVAKHMPGDYDIQYASPWAGANYFPVGKPGTLLQKLEKETWPELSRLAMEVVEAGIHFQDALLYKRMKDVGTTVGDWLDELVNPDACFKDYMPNYRVLPNSDLRDGIDSAVFMTSVCINPAIYLPWLMGQCLKNNVIFKRGVLTHISQATDLHHSGDPTQIIVNCTGLSSRFLGGVEDSTLYPGRGQIVLVRNNPSTMATASGSDDGPDEVTYVMARAAGGGTVLGGCLQKDNYESQHDPDLATRIMKRCVELVPSLTNGEGIEKLSIIRHGVGLRPMRIEGPKIEKEKVKGIWIVHNYGHGGYGYQSSYGSAIVAEKLMDEILQQSTEGAAL